MESRLEHKSTGFKTPCLADVTLWLLNRVQNIEGNRYTEYHIGSSLKVQSVTGYQGNAYKCFIRIRYLTIEWV